jgi:hypothetical protein
VDAAGNQCYKKDKGAVIATGQAAVTAQSERNFSIAPLQLRITSEHKGIVREGNAGEVLIPLTLAKGRSTLTLEYQW